ncbi:putative nuclease HARBI1 [Prorops nasuta]|uniref:putative nuclease HARBI1 n=1 Tax=Prorops nasuta TaxID=863751 RepID=UPI0034CF1F52
MPPYKQIALTLWFLGNQDTYRSIGDRFGVSKDCVWNSVFEVMMILVENVQRFIKWPEPHLMTSFEQRFQELSGFPGVIGAIDGSHIAITAPIENYDSYINRKGFHSVILQGICDYKLRFIHVFAGICGSVYDARVWRISDIKQLIDHDENRYFQNQYHLLGDSAYPLSNFLLTPYRDNGHLNDRENNYNTKHSQTRTVIERAFGILKNRFRKLKYIYMYNTEMIPLVIITSCILHNICIKNEDEPMDIHPIDMQETQINEEMFFISGLDKRDIISNLL